MRACVCVCVCVCVSMSECAWTDCQYLHCPGRTAERKCLCLDIRAVSSFTMQDWRRIGLQGVIQDRCISRKKKTKERQRGGGRGVAGEREGGGV